jgi:hypothetical protein
MLLAWVYHKRLDFNKIAKLKGPHTCIIAFIQKNHHQDIAKFVTSTVFTLMIANISMIIMSIQEKNYIISHKRSHLKCYLNYCWHSKNQVLVLLFNRVTMKILIVKQLFLKEFSSHFSM